MRVLVEVIHVTAGLMAAVLIGKLSAWAYPLGTRDIWLVTFVAMAAVLLMAVDPVRRAISEDRATMRDGGG